MVIETPYSQQFIQSTLGKAPSHQDYSSVVPDTLDQSDGVMVEKEILYQREANGKEAVGVSPSLEGKEWADEETFKDI